MRRQQGSRQFQPQLAALLFCFQGFGIAIKQPCGYSPSSQKAPST